MNHRLYIASLILFLLLPPALLVVHGLRPKYLPWWALILLVMAGGWVLVNALVLYYFNYLGDLIRAAPNPSPQLMDEINADGAKRVFAFLFGWLYGLIYLCPWLLVFGLIQRTRRHFRRAL